MSDMQLIVDDFINTHPNSTLEDLLDHVSELYNDSVDKKAEELALQDKVTKADEALKQAIEDYNTAVENYKKATHKAPKTKYFTTNRLSSDSDKIGRLIRDFFI